MLTMETVKAEGYSDNLAPKASELVSSTSRNCLRL